MNQIESRTKPAFTRIATASGLLAVTALSLLAVVLAGPPALASQARAASTKASSSKAQTASAEAQDKASPIDVNTAGVEALTDLPGIGHSTAQRIVDYRKEHGPFKTVDELLSVKGIGEKSLARFRDRVTVGAGGKN
jgi:competence protein ComEA